MAERCMTEVVAECHRLREIFVESQGTGYCACNLCDLKGMGKSCAVVVTRRRQKDLSFMLQSAKRVGMYYPVTVALKRSPYGTFVFISLPAPAVFGKARSFGQCLTFYFHRGFAYYVRHNITSVLCSIIYTRKFAFSLFLFQNFRFGIFLAYFFGKKPAV